MKTLLAALAALVLVSAQAEETHAARIVEGILANAARLKAADPEAVPMAFWDFDGTIIKGDLSEGLVENGQLRYKGLVQRTIEEGLSSVYPKAGGWEQYQKDYRRLNEIGRWLAWPFNAQMFDGKPAAALDAFATAECQKVYRKWYFASTMKMMTALERAGVENYVVSASPEIFVRNTAETLGLGRDRIRAIRVEIACGRLTTRLAYPLSYNEGKVENVRDIVLARPHGYALAGFGNSYQTDGPFLKYIATQASLPGGAKGTGVMINGGKPRAGYAEHFILVDQDEAVGDASNVSGCRGK